jgi:signal transduction histidine kinase
MSDKLRVLYAEDSPVDADLTTQQLEQINQEFEIDVVVTGETCLSRLAERKYDVLLLDHHLPDMDAIDVLKALSERRILLPVVVVTGVGDEGLVVQLLRLGAWDYVPKNADYLKVLPAVLRNAAIEHIKLRAQGHATGRRQRRVLYVEHHAADIDLTLQHFAEAAPHLNLETVHSATHALNKLRTDTYDLVLTDLRTPDMTALDLLRETKYRGLRIPFIIITGHGDETAAVAALKLGAYDYIVKRANYLVQLPYAIDNAISRFQLGELNRRLQEELGERRRAEAERKEAEAARGRLEEELRHAQKLESIGRLAGGIAHDFNNLLTVINGYADLMLNGLGENDPLRAGLTEIIRAGERASGMTRQLLAFSRKQLLQPREVALNSIVSESRNLLQRLLGENIELITELDKNLGTVWADAGQIDQVILNLAVNARDAMPDGGRLTIRTANTTLAEGEAQARFELQPGRYVKLTISDTGCGITEEDMPRLFEPYFTTKEPGRGTGLGLSTVYGILKQSRGSIAVRSEPGKGTTFDIVLPRMTGTVAQAPPERREIDDPHGSETVLVVEDEEIVRKMTCTSLRKYGYEVVEARNGKDALTIMETTGARISLVLTDVVMPEMSGQQLGARLQQLHPQPRVLYMSGYTDDDIVRQGLADPSIFFLQKPFTPFTLAQRVREVLDANRLGP